MVDKSILLEINISIFPFLTRFGNLPPDLEALKGAFQILDYKKIKIFCHYASAQIQ